MMCGGGAEQLNFTSLQGADLGVAYFPFALAGTLRGHHMGGGGVLLIVLWSEGLATFS